MDRYRSTREVAREIGVGCSALSRAVWDGRIPSPKRSPQGAFLWLPDDIERARRAMKSRR